MDHGWYHFWWLIFPVLAMVLALAAMAFRYRRHKDTVELLRTYAAQGKDPPAELIKALHSHNGRPRGPDRDWQRAILFGGLTVAFGVMAYSRADMHGPHDGIVFVAIVFGALTLGAIVSAVLQQRRRHDHE